MLVTQRGGPESLAPIHEARAVKDLVCHEPQLLTDRFGDNVPAPPDWPPDILEQARQSWIRCLRVEHDHFNLPTAGTQFVVSELRASDVIDHVEGPPLEDAHRWWERYLADQPEETDRRERSTATLDDLRHAAP